MRTAHGYLLFLGTLAVAYSTAAYFSDLDTDFYVSAIVAVCLLFGAVCVDYLAHERERRDERIALCRKETWARRDREAGL